MGVRSGCEPLGQKPGGLGPEIRKEGKGKAGRKQPQSAGEKTGEAQEEGVNWGQGGGKKRSGNKAGPCPQPWGGSRSPHPEPQGLWAQRGC